MKIVPLVLLSLALLPACDSMKRLTEGRDDPNTATVLHDTHAKPTPKPGASPDPDCDPQKEDILEVYTDRTGINGSRFRFNLSEGSREVEGDAPEGTRYLALTGPMSVQTDPIDLRAFFGGTLQFYVRLKQPIQADTEFLVSLGHNDGGEPYPPLGAQHGFNPNSLDWQLINVPLDFYSPDQYERFIQVFGVTMFGPQPQDQRSYDIDKVIWIKPS
jgi:hypothetical protein